MARLSDERYVLMEDTREKAITARSARHTRTHNGKGGAVKFPSDYLSAKEKKKLNGECKSYRMNEPISWKEFKTWPDEHKITYIKLLRQKFNVPDSHIAAMMGVTHMPFSKLSNELGLSRGRNYTGRKDWDREGFAAWCGKTVEEPVEIPVEEETKEPETVEEKTVNNATLNVDLARVDEACRKMSDAIVEVVDKVMTESCDNRGAVPSNGTLTFEGKSEDILRTLKDILGGRYVRLSVQWSVEDAPVELAPVELDTSMLANAAKTIDYALLNNQRRQATGSKG